MNNLLVAYCHVSCQVIAMIKKDCEIKEMYAITCSGLYIRCRMLYLFVVKD